MIEISKSKIPSTGNNRLVRAFAVNNETFYMGDDLAKALGFSGASAALAELAGDADSNGDDFIRWIVLDKDRLTLILNEAGKEALMGWGRKRGRIPQGLTIELNSVFWTTERIAVK